MGKTVQQMQFTMTGFTQDVGCRVFAYEGIGEDRARIKFTVRADLAMSRKYGIRLQELPLMCLGILERSMQADEAGCAAPIPTDRALSYTEEAMMQYSDECVAARGAAALKRTSLRRQPPKTAAAPAEFNPYSEIPAAPAKPYGENW